MQEYDCADEVLQTALINTNNGFKFTLQNYTSALDILPLLIEINQPQC